MTMFASAKSNLRMIGVAISLACRRATVRRQAFRRIPLARFAICGVLGLAFAASALSDSATMTISPSSQALGATDSTDTSFVTSSPSTISLAWTGNGKAWNITANVSSHNGPETAVSLTLTNGGTGVTLNTPASILAATPTIASDSTKPPGGTVCSVGITVTVPANTAPGSFSGTITFVLSGGANDTKTLTYSYTVPKHGSITVGPPSSQTLTNTDTTFTSYVTAPASPTDLTLAANDTWSITASLSTHTGPETAAFITLTNKSGSATFPTSNPINIFTGNPVIATGSAFSSARLCSVAITLTLPANSTPTTSNNTGTINLQLTVNGVSQTLATLTYSYSIPRYLNVTLDQGLSFHVTTPGVVTSPQANPTNSYCTINTSGNVAFHLTAAVTGLDIPIWLAIDNNSAFTNINFTSLVNNNSNGLASIRYPLTNGTTVGPANNVNYFLSGRVKTTTSHTPGTHSGTLTVTIVVGG